MTAPTADDAAPDSGAIILLMKPLEASFFRDYIASARTGLTVLNADTSDALDQLAHRAPPGSRLIAFSTNIIVPPQILDRLSGNCINFHPGPPEFPGYRPAGFALYQEAPFYGVTAHYMTERVDEGPIIGVERFKVAPDAWMIDVVKESYMRLARLFVRLLPMLTDLSRPVPTIAETWSGHKTRRTQYEEMRRITPGMEEAEVARRFRCFDGIYCPVEDWRDSGSRAGV